MSDLSKFDPSRAVPVVDDKAFDPSRAVPLETPAKPTLASEAKRIGSDTVASLAKGALGVAEMPVGLGDMVTGGAIGKLLETEYGFKPKEWKENISSKQSPELRADQKAVQDAQGFLPTVVEAVKRPATIFHSAVESLPGTIVGAGVGRAAAARGFGTHAAAGIGEGAVTAGQQVEQVRQETPDGLVTPGQIALAAGSGAVTGLIGAGSGMVAKKVGLRDIDEMLIAGNKTPVAKGLVPRVALGAVTEGALEELPQSAQEQIAQNVALGKSWDEGVGNAAAMGMLTGAGMGGAMNIPGPLTKAGAVAQAQEQARMMPIKNQEAAQMRASALTTETGMPHEVVPHPTVGGAFAVQPTEAGNGTSDTVTGTKAGVGANVQPGNDDAAQRAGGAGMERQSGAAAVGEEPAAGGTAEGNRQPAGAAGDADGLSTSPVIGPLTNALTAAQGVPNGTAEPIDEAVDAPTSPYSNVGASKIGGPLDLRMDSPFDEAAHTAANSPFNERKPSTIPQQDANNAKLGAADFQGLPIRIENPQGSVRESRPDAPVKWKSLMTEHYGYVAGTKGMDGDPIDIFVGPDVNSPKAFVIDQTVDGKPDEHKVMLGFASLEEARTAYHDNYQKDWQGGQAIHETTVDGLKAWLKAGDTTKPFAAVTAGTQPVSRTAAGAAAPASQTADSLAANGAAIPQPADPALAPSPTGSSPEATSSLLPAQQQSAPGSASTAASGPALPGGNLLSGGSKSVPSQSPDKVSDAKETPVSLGASIAVETEKPSSPEVKQAETDKVLPQRSTPALPPTFANAEEAQAFADENKLQAIPFSPPGSDHFVLAPYKESDPAEEKRDELKVSILNRDLGKYSNGGTTVKAVHKISSIERIVKAISRQAFGADLTYVTKNGLFSGVASRGRVFVVAGEPAGGMLNTAFHEIKHTMQQKNRALADKLEKFVMSYVNGGVVQARGEKEKALAEKAGTYSDITEQGVRDEVMADINGALAMDPKFWKAMAKHDESLFRQVSYRLMELLTGAIKIASGTYADITTLVSDVDAVREAVAKGWAQYNAERTGDKSKPARKFKLERKAAPQMKREDDTGRDTLPTRIPTGVGAEAPLSAMQIADYDAMRSDPAQFAKAVDMLLEHPGMQSLRRDTTEASAEAIIERMQSNLTWLYDQVPHATRERSKLWYDGARAIAERWADRYDLTVSQASGILAVLSPQKDWYMNVTMAERILDIMKDQQDHVFDPAMRAAAFKFLLSDMKDDTEGKANMTAYRATNKMSLADTIATGDALAVGIWLRAYDEAHNSRSHTLVSPEGNFTGDAGMRAWGGFRDIGKAALIFRDGSPATISRSLGGNHKVRNFYNNIYAPRDQRFTTIDTHAVAAAELVPWSGSDVPVIQNFGNPKSKASGINGTYPIFYEAYRRAAEAAGILPREMQSITWEAVRGLFTDTYKRGGAKGPISAIWNRVSAGEISIDQARQEVREHAGGIDNPTWQNEVGVIEDKSYKLGRDPFVGRKLTFEVAPHPSNTALKALWDALDPQVKLDISQEIAFDIAGRALASLSDRAKGELHAQLGGYGADSNPSLSIWLDKYVSGTEFDKLARMLGHALQQESMQRTSPEPFKGGTKYGAILIDLPAGMDNAAMHALYERIRTLTDSSGEPLATGHTTSAEQMAILDDGTRISKEAFAQKVQDLLGDDYKVGYNELYAQFLEQGEDNYGLDPQSSKDGVPSESPLRTLADQLRAEAQARLEAAVGQGGLQYSRREDEAEGVGPTFYSALERGLEQLPTDKAGMVQPAQAKMWIASKVKAGLFKQAEVEWSGINDFIDLQKGKVSKQALQEYVRNNGVKIDETLKGDDGNKFKTVAQAFDFLTGLYNKSEDAIREEWGYRDDADYITVANSEYDTFREDGASDTQYGQYTLPGGANYRELLLHLPEGRAWAWKDAQSRLQKYRDQLESIEHLMALNPDLVELGGQLEQGLANLKSKIAALEATPKPKQLEDYRSPHWKEGNILAHVRFTDHEDTEGNRVLFIEELQSDWAQQGKKEGFRSEPNQALAKEINARINGMLRLDGPEWDAAEPEFHRLQREYRKALGAGLPIGPFVTKTEAWLSLGLKRMIRYAAENGYDRVAFVNGQQSADRYDLSQQVSSLAYDGKTLEAWDHERTKVLSERVEPEKLDDYIGKEAAAKLLAQPQVMGKHLLDGENLKVGGEGMIAFYDHIVPQVTNDVLKKLGGGKVMPITIPDGGIARDLVAQENSDTGYWGVFDRANQEWLYEFEEESFTSKPNHAAHFTERAAKDMATALTRDGSTKPTTQMGFDMTQEMIDGALAGQPMFSRVGVDSPAFKSWFAGSKIVNADSTPKVMYHGTARDIETFMSKQAGAIFVSPKANFAEDYAQASQDWMNSNYESVLTGDQIKEAKAEALKLLKANIADDFGYGPNTLQYKDAVKQLELGNTKGFRANQIAKEYMDRAVQQQMPSGPNMQALYVKAVNPFDFDDPRHIELIRNYYTAHLDEPNPLKYTDLASIEDGRWSVIEQSRVQQALRMMGFDSFYVMEGGVKNLAVYKPTQLKSATGNMGTYDPNDGRVQFSRKPPAWINQVQGMTPDLAEKVGAWVPGKTIAQRWKELRRGLGDKLVQSLFDQYAPIKKLDLHSYILARMTKSVDGAVEAMLDYGKVGIDGNGALTTDMQGGFKETLAKLQGEQDRFFAWVAGMRSDMLKQQGRENLFTAGDITTLKSLNQGLMADGTSRAILYARINREMQAFNKSVLDVAEQTGVIDPIARTVWEQQYYVPFFRLSEDDDTFTPSNVSGLANAKGIQRLRGGANNLGDLMQNTVMNWNYLLSASLKNQAATFTLVNAEQVGAAVQIGGAVKGSVFVLDGGRKRHYMVTDPALATAVGSISFTGIRGPIIDAASAMKRALSFGVTFSPSYRIRNIIRDQLQAISVNPMSYNVAANLINGLKYSSKDNPMYAQMLAAGGVIRMGVAYEDNRAANLKRQVAKLDPATLLNSPDKIKSVLGRIYDSYMETGERAEAATRMAIGKKALDDGESALEAAFRMRDSMDFGLQGSSTAVRVLAQVVPFFNARMQGMYKLGRGAKENPARFGVVVGATAAATIALMLANAGDPDWEEREEWDRNNFWWFKVGGTAFRIPKPFEVGALATVAERGLEMVLAGMDERSRERFSKQTLAVLMDNLSMNPVPQIVKPMIETFANKDTFRNRQIESEADQRLSKNERTGPATSQSAILLARGVNAVTSSLPGGDEVLSPKQIDFMIQGYFGWLGSHLAAAADFALRPMMGAPEKATRKLDETFVAGDWVRELPASQSRFVSEFYDQSRKVQQAMADINHYKKMGDVEKVKELIDDNRALLQNRTAYTESTQVMGRINTRLKQVGADTKLSADEKRQEIDRLNTLRNKLAKKVVEGTFK